MKVNSISGLIYLAKDPVKSAEFYENLGFLVSNKKTDMASVRVNWFWIDFVKVGPHTSTGGDGQCLYVSVSDVDETYEQLKAKGLEATKPMDFKTGRRETMVSDPDGYRIVFYKKK